MSLQPDPAGLTLGGLFVTSFVITMSGAVMPGPLLAVTITHAARLGVKAGPLIVLGHAILETALVAALVAGLGRLLVLPVVSGLVGGVGAVILVGLGLAMLKSLPSLKLELTPGQGQASAAGPVRDGLLLSLANPYWSLWWATVGLSLLALALDSGLAWAGLLVFFAGHLGADLAWYVLVSMVVAKGRRFLTDRLHRAVVGVCAVFLLGFAAYFGLFAWRQLAGVWG